MPTKQITERYGPLISRMVAAGWTDDEMADVLDVTRVTVLLARRRLGLRAPYRGRTKERCHRARQERFEAEFVPLADPCPARGTTPLDSAIDREARGRLGDWLSRAGRRVREAVELIAEGRSLAEIGRRLGLSRERARQIRARLVHRMRRRLRPPG